MPNWLVRVEKALPNGHIVRGAGYVIQFKGQSFVRTASHITLGQLENVKIFDHLNRPVPFNRAMFVTNNMLDDQLIQIEHNSIRPLAIYNPLVDRLLVTAEAFAQYAESKRRVYPASGLVTLSGYVSPSWVKREQFTFSQRQINYQLRALGDISYQKDFGFLRETLSKDLLIADFSILPGESGSPLIGWSDSIMSTVSNIDQTILQARVERGFKLGFFDDHNQRINAVAIGGNLAFIKGHVIAYHRSLPISKFISSSHFTELQEAFTEKVGQDISSTSWALAHGQSFRIFSSDGNIITELAQNSIVGGDGTSADGGDGTSADGGDGTSADGGGQNLSRKLSYGLTINSRHVVSFKLLPVKNMKYGRYMNDLFRARSNLELYFMAGSFLNASWYNFVFLRNLQQINKEKIYEPIYSNSDLTHYFNQRFALAQQQRTGEYSCRLNREALRDHRIEIDIQLGADKTAEVLKFSAPIDKLLTVSRFSSQKFGTIDVDLGGLFGFDFSFSGEHIAAHDDMAPYIVIRNKSYLPEVYQCVMR